MPVCKRSNDTLGFTLIELLLGICLLCLIVTLAVPTYGHWIASRQLANHAEFLTETLNLARSEAVKRGLRVNLCKTVDRHQCADAGGWESGWIMFVDANKSGEIDAAEDVLHVEGPPGNGITVSANTLWPIMCRIPASASRGSSMGRCRWARSCCASRD